MEDTTSMDLVPEVPENPLPKTLDLPGMYSTKYMEQLRDGWQRLYSRYQEPSRIWFHPSDLIIMIGYFFQSLY